ncbi:condensation domain-containing protein [Actinomadura violacea]|uniref:AMP-binding protein n=1 Tax=Actinomadura violacea TaxID=2819934 RepID=A0ABS3RK09_9ACTN|nr:condensation domain-containing protein [Actinomadura violacea]MBO2456936.1 AMP-binding protein [Actinomadura violacea]
MDSRIGQGVRPGRDGATAKEKALWLLEKLVPGTGINNITVALHVDGRLRPEALETSIGAVAGRHAILRTVFSESDAGLVKEVIPASAFRVAIEPLELSGGPLEEDMAGFAGRPFELDGRPLLRAGLAAHPDGDVLCLAFHHLVSDLLSVAAFMRAFVPVYDAVSAGRPAPPQPPEPTPVARDAQAMEADLAYWREHLRGYTPSGLDLWCGLPRPGTPLMTGGSVTRTLSPEGQAAVVRLQREVRAPVAAVLLAAYFALLAAHGAGPDLVVGSPLDVRGPRSQAMGYHVNVVPLRLQADLDEGFRQLAKRARDTFLGAMSHAGASVDDLSAELPRTGSSWSTTLYRHFFNFLPDISSGDLAIGGMGARLLTIPNAFSKFDLELFAVPSKAEIWFRYATEILDRADVEALLRRYEALLIEAVRDVDRPLRELAGWSEADRAIADAANRTAKPVTPGTVPEAFLSWARTAPDEPAVVDGPRTLSYRQVREAAAGVRNLLQGAGVGPGDVVAVDVPHGPDLVTAVLGIWLAGAAYLPDAASAASAGAKVVLVGAGTGAAGEGEVPLGAAVPDPAAPEPATAPAAVACLLPADDPSGSASSGPVRLSHGGVANLAGHFAAELAAGPGTGTLSLAAPSSCGSLLELFLPLATGGRVVIAPAEARTDPAVLRRTVEEQRVEIVQLSPGASARVLDGLSGVRVLARPEDVPPWLARRLADDGCQVHAVRGDARTCGWVLSGRLDEQGGPAGERPITNTRAFVLAPDGRELPTGVRGELCVAGAGVTPDAPDRPPYGRLHRTGELVRRRPDGALERLGRLGRRVVVAETPVDLDRVEAALTGQAGVTAAAALVVADPEAGDTLVAFAETADEPQWRPPAGVPGLVVRLDLLPRGADGLVDHDAVARLALERLAAGTAASAPSASGPPADDDLVQRLVELWARLLKVEATAETGFFEAGGHSLLAAVLAQEVEELTGVHLELSEIFEHKTPVALAARLAAG